MRIGWIARENLPEKVSGATGRMVIGKKFAALSGMGEGGLKISRSIIKVLERKQKEEKKKVPEENSVQPGLALLEFAGER